LTRLGFDELARAIWQALCELNTTASTNFPKPSNSEEHEEALGSFELFWDSEVLRIGEKGAQGFSSYSNEHLGDLPSPKDLPMADAIGELSIENPDFWGDWTEWEVTLSSKSPARTTDEIEEDDPYRVILFRDMEKFLYCFQIQEVCDCIPSVLQSFLKVSLRTPYSLDTFVHSNLAFTSVEAQVWFWPIQETSRTKLITWVHGEIMEPERQNQAAETPFQFQAPNIPITLDTLFPPPTWFCCLADQDTNESEKEFTSNTLMDLVQRSRSLELTLTVLALAFKNQQQKPIVKKMVKQFIKANPNYVIWYVVYAIIEWRIGNVESARTVFSTALSMGKSIPDIQPADILLLRRSWALEELYSQNEPQMLQILLAIPESCEVIKQEYSAPAVLKARKVIRSKTIS